MASSSSPVFLLSNVLSSVLSSAAARHAPVRWAAFAVVVVGVLFAGAGRAQIAPECEGVEKPADYDESAQQTHLQNYFAAGFLLTPLLEPLPRPGRATIAFEAGVIPPLSCERRLVLDGSKTEDTNKSPVLPRLRLRFALPAVGPVATFGGLALLPPLPSPVGTLLIVGAELGAGARFFDDQLSLALRTHMHFSRMRGEIASPFVKGDPAVDDLFFTNGLGADVAAGWRFTPLPWLAIVPSTGAGVADVSTFFVVGDDGVIVQNTEAPWWGPLLFTGVQAELFDVVVVSAEASYAIPLYPTVKLGLGLTW